MSTIEAATTAPIESGNDTAVACTACAHAADAHDPIGLRYCSATLEGGLDRGCVCSPAKKTDHRNRNYQ